MTVVIRPVTVQPHITFGENANLAGLQAARAEAAAIDAERSAAGTRSYDEVIAATAAVNGFEVSVTDGKIARGDTLVSFADSVTIEAPDSTTVTDAAYTLSYLNGESYWGYLTTKLPHGNLTNLVVKDATTLAVLVQGTDYVADTRFGGLARATAGSNRNVLVSYIGSEERYDLICVDPEYDHPLYAVQGEAGVRDASERIPDSGTIPEGETAIPMRLPLFNARVTAQGVELVKLWNLRDGVAREFEAQFLADQRRNRDALLPFLEMVEAGEDTTWSAIGDSITAIQSEVPDLIVPNGQYRDKATSSGASSSYLREGIIGTDLIDAIRDDYDNGDAAGATHTRFGRMWDLVRAAEDSFAGNVTYRNYSVGGTSSDDSSYGMNDPARRAAWAEDGSDLGIILDGMNSRATALASPGLLFTRIRTLIDTKRAAGAKGVIVWGLSRPNGTHNDDEAFLLVNRILRRAAMTPGPGGYTAAFIDPSLISYGEGVGTMGIVPQDYCLANGASHPGIRQHRIEGEFARKVIFGSAGKRAVAGATWSSVYKGATIVLTSGNLSVENSNGAGAWQSVRGTVARTTGKWYYEVHHDEAFNAAMIGVANAAHSQSTFTGSDTNSVSYSTGGTVFFNGGTVTTETAHSNGDTIGVALDVDAGKVWFSHNGTWENGDPEAGTGGATAALGTFYPSVSMYNTDGKLTANFGASAFAHSAPEGFAAWNG